MSDMFPKRARLADTVEMLEELVRSQGDVIATAVQPGDLAAVATSGSYSDLIDTPQLAAVATSGSYSDLIDTPQLAAVATSGSYSDLIDTPQGAAVPDSTAEDVEGLVEDFNALLTSLRNAGLIASE